MLMFVSSNSSRKIHEQSTALPAGPITTSAIVGTIWHNHGLIRLYFIYMRVCIFIYIYNYMCVYIYIYTCGFLSHMWFVSAYLTTSQFQHAHAGDFGVICTLTTGVFFATTCQSCHGRSRQGLGICQSRRRAGVYITCSVHYKLST